MEDARAEIQEARAFVERLTSEVGLVVVGQQVLVSRLLISLLTGGHILLEGLPGLAKTLVVRTLAAALDLSYRRIQFTPDLLPADVIGTLIYDPKNSDFRVHKGPIFANIVLADEINRAPAKVQSALLEAMQEGRVTIGQTTYQMEQPFVVFATQNPLEHEGTYPLPEAQLDRFLLNCVVDYPTHDEEREILRRNLRELPPAPQAVVTSRDVVAARAAVARVFVDPRIESYVIDLVRATRDRAVAAARDRPAALRYGASPRAGVHLALAARAQAFLEGRAFVLPEDVRDLAADVLRHRVVVSYEAEADGLTSVDVIAEILDSVPVP